MKFTCLKCGNNRVSTYPYDGPKTTRAAIWVAPRHASPFRESAELIEDYYHCHFCDTQMRVKYQLSVIEVLGSK